MVDGRLYLFGKPIGPGMMRANIAAMKSEADQNWSKVSKDAGPGSAGLHEKHGRIEIAPTGLRLSVLAAGRRGAPDF